jgi:uncharacterized protein DUF1326
MATAWRLSGDYFENCSCTVVCPCLISPRPQLTSKPTQGACDVPLAFHIDAGKYGDVRLDGLNVVLVVHTPGPMGEGNWTAAAYIDERADERQTEALGAIFTGMARAQQAIPTIGFLHPGSAGSFDRFVAAFRSGLNQVGFKEGQNVVIEFRWAEDRPDRLPELEQIPADFTHSLRV